jgi:hypothetical protein
MSVLLAFFLILIGLGACLFGYSRWKGKMHGSYFIYGFFHEANYLAIPIGISSIVMGIAILPIIPNSFQLVLIYIGIVVMLLGFLVAWRLFKPEWVKWIEQNHKEIIPHLAVEIRDYGWHVNTQAELEQWIAEVRRKHGL